MRTGGAWVRRTVAGVVGLVCVAAMVAAQVQPQQPTFRGGARFVRVDVYPADRDGKPVQGLTAADFEIYEDGKPQAIDTFEFVRVEAEPEAIRVDPNSQAEGEALARDPRARVFAIVLDTGHVDIASGRDVRQPLVDMLDRLIGSRDLFGVITPELPASSFILGRRTTTLADMVNRYWFWGNDDALIPRDGMEQLLDSCFGSRMSVAGARTRDLVARYRERQTLEHLHALVEKLQDIREERKSVIVVGRGWRLFEPDRDALDSLVELFRSPVPSLTNRGGRIQTGTPPQRPGEQDFTDCMAQATGLYMMSSGRSFKDLMEKATRANVAFYPIDPRGLAPFDEPISMGVRSAAVDNAHLRARADGLRTLAANTDGLAFIMNNELDEQFRRLTDSLSAYYLVGYYSTNTKFDGKYRRIEVKVRKPDVQVRARRGYVAPTEAEIAAIAAGREATAGTPDAAETALADALSRLAQVRQDRDLFVQTAIVPGALIVNAELGPSARTSPAWSEGGAITVTASGGATASETKRLDPMRSGASFRIPMTSAADVRVQLRARAAGAGPSSGAEATALASAETESLLGTVLTYRGLARALMPAADGRYRRTERATLEAALADGAVAAGARVLDRTGKPLNVPVASRERRDAGGVRWMSVDVSLAPLTDGDYIIELEAMKDAARERKLFAIRVVR